MVVHALKLIVVVPASAIPDMKGPFANIIPKPVAISPVKMELYVKKTKIFTNVSLIPVKLKVNNV